MIINEYGQKIFRGQEALDSFAKGISRLMEGRKLHYKTSFQDIPVSVENRKGSVRSGTDEDGDEWKTKMKKPYGYIPGTKGVDGDALDVFVGPDENAAFAYVVHCNTPDGEQFDEDKVMLGFDSAKSAKQCFLQHYDDPKFFGGMDAIPMWKFRDKIWVKKETTRKLVASRAGMKHSMLGHHQDIMIDPEVREGGPGSGPQRSGKVEASETHPPGTSVKQVLDRAEALRKQFPHLDPVITGSASSGFRIDLKTKKIREGGPGSGPRAAIEKAGGKYRGMIEDPKRGKYHLFDDPSAKHASTLTMHEKDIHGPESVKAHMDSKKKEFGESKEHGVKGQKWGDKQAKSGYQAAHDLRKSVDEMAQMRKGFGNLFQSGALFQQPKKEAEEHGVKGMKWGIKHARHDAAGQKAQSGKPKSLQNRDLSHDPRTLNMMQHVQSAEKQLNSQPHNANVIGQMTLGQQKVNSQQNHDAAKEMLKQLGWKVAGTAANLLGVGGMFQSVRSLVQTPQGQKMFLHTGRSGDHSISSDERGTQKPHLKQPRPPVRAKASIESQRPFEERLGTFLREAKKKRVYYARSLQRYGTAAEAGEKDILREEYPDHKLDFPRTRRHAELGMGYFHDKIDKAKEVIITPFRGRHVTAGVFSEARHAIKRGIPVRVLRRDGSLRTVKDLVMNEGGNPHGQYARIILKVKSARKKK